jgi:hypothetical protein
MVGELDCKQHFLVRIWHLHSKHCQLLGCGGGGCHLGLHRNYSGGSFKGGEFFLRYSVHMLFYSLPLLQFVLGPMDLFSTIM